MFGSIKVVIKVVKVVMFIHTIPELDKSMNPASPSCWGTLLLAVHGHMQHKNDIPLMR